jgi:hypothetical protein
MMLFSLIVSVLDKLTHFVSELKYELNNEISFVKSFIDSLLDLEKDINFSKLIFKFGKFIVLLIISFA